jgi:AraC-like DNA-binding protein
MQDPHTFPAVHALHLVELLGRWGVPPEALLRGSGLTLAAISAPTARLTIPQFADLIDRARQLTGEPGLGFHLGLQMRISAHGYLGFAAMTAGTVREALEVAARFTPTRTTALALHLRLEGAEARLVIEERAALGRARDVVVIALLVGLAQIGQTLTGQTLSGGVDLALPRPDYFARFAHLARGRVRFGQPESCLRFDAAALDVPLLNADPVALQLARAQCERDLDAVMSAPGPAGVRALLRAAEGDPPTLEEAAARLHLSPRTLKRRLAAQGTTYSALLDEARRERAEALLRAGDLSIDEVAERLGYSDTANFTRAFRRWTGVTPSRFRKAEGG